MNVEYVRVYQDKHSVSDMKNLVKQYNGAGDLNKESHRSLNLHLASLSVIEQKEKSCEALK